ncbi:ABC transporter ATP-binding protein [Streptomyces marincola]|uniref:ABC transporter ATP-binding protein n=1 Tax=Streptomyces marincola TaxID=2878388 RepID=UPI001CF5EBFA|nr:ATP-binding cassette domain-containing protein [Streptomyces marincola]UCM87047.1 ATP-binding cassette domain-containing protein [Streptomyces marincola]
MTLVEVSELSLAAGGRPVLSGCSLTLRAGERVGLVGRSGSGKTALAHALLGHTRAGLDRTGGTVRVAGIDPFSRAGARQVRGRLVAYLPQDCAATLPAEHRVGWVLDRAAGRAGVPRARRAAERARALERVRLPADLARSFPHQISGGQAQRVALAAVLAAGARLIVLDEPTSGLDPALVDDVVELLRTATGDAALLVVSHDPEVVDRLTERRLTMAGGRLAEGTGAAPAAAGRTVAAAPPRAAPPGPPVLLAEGVTGGPGRPAVLAGAGLSLGAGECVAVLGASGAGKTTLARALAGTAVPAGGRLWLGGDEQPWPVARRTRAARLLVAHVDQDSRGALNPRERIGTALERARAAARRGGVDAPPVADLLAGVSLPAGAARRYPGELSGGERQRANLARALAAGPRVLLCDEVTASLDGATEDEVLDLLGRLRRAHGLAVVLITHSRRVASGADRCLVLRDGQLAPAGPGPGAPSATTAPAAPPGLPCTP